VDTDQDGFSIGVVNRTSGKAYTGVLIRDPGVYGHFEKFTLQLAIGSNGLVHCTFDKKNGTTAEDLTEFIEGLLPRLGNVRKTVMTDNLSSHFSPATQYAFNQSIHRMLPRPAYCPKFAPIEYIFNQIEQELKLRMYAITNELQLIAAVHDIIGHLKGVRETFVHCGYV
jgi:hypothetical protein